MKYHFSMLKVRILFLSSKTSVSFFNLRKSHFYLLSKVWVVMITDSSENTELRGDIFTSRYLRSLHLLIGQIQVCKRGCMKPTFVINSEVDIKVKRRRCLSPVIRAPGTQRKSETKCWGDGEGVVPVLCKRACGSTKTLANTVWVFQRITHKMMWLSNLISGWVHKGSRLGCSKAWCIIN